MIIKSNNENIVTVSDFINLVAFKDSKYNRILSRKQIKATGKEVFYGCLDRLNVRYWIVAHKT